MNGLYPLSRSRQAACVQREKKQDACRSAFTAHFRTSSNQYQPHMMQVMGEWERIDPHHRGIGNGYGQDKATFPIR
ncbi:hypothetical protein D3W54_00650 [Komagataeibacter medellinensis]|uniref:Uncharacterized protein n=1 Tax=Komagataeibacter medellinensis TaxID=1177712 RepID=A0ABQ6VRS5_9PROT|nr:hypothetical protein D3W54_00005 [Komagataeibacter medellinensis]KAB8122988.1 hypothetical protein D3W54_00650 [Komagataeibacter medellinensis]